MPPNKAMNRAADRTDLESNGFWPPPGLPQTFADVSQMRYTLVDLLAVTGVFAIAIGMHPFQSVLAFVTPSLLFAGFWSFRATHDRSRTIANASKIGAKSAFLAILAYGFPLASYELWSTLQWSPLSQVPLQILGFRIVATALVLLYVIVFPGAMAALGGALIGAGVGAVAGGGRPLDNHRVLGGEPSDEPKSWSSRL